MFELKNGNGRNIFTKQCKSDYDGLMNGDVEAAQSICIKLARISDENLFRPRNCLIKNYTMEWSQ